MKKIILFLVLSMVIVTSAEAHRRKAHITISIQTFYDQLSPYGDWIYTSDYGYVWRPYFDHPESFRPYSSGGNWVYTKYGWTWNSDYNWGWATFHYGRWDFDNYLGWLWIPGYEWAPAWVSWGYYNDYWGWAPLGPNIYAQVNLNWYAPDPWWTFVPRRHFCAHNWNHYIYDRPVHVTNITYINNVYLDNDNAHGSHNSWYQGPRVSDVERYSRSRVRSMEVVDNERAENTGVRNNRLNVYRPSVENSTRNTRPVEYRKAEQIRTGRKIEQTNARTNDPGTNRTRGIRTEARNITQIPSLPNSNESRVKNTESPSANSTRNSRNPDKPTESKVIRGTNPNTESRNGTTNKETREEPRMGTQVYPERSSSRSAADPQKENNNRGNNNKVTEKNSTANSPSRIEKTDDHQLRNSSPDLNKVYSNPTRESVNKPSPSVQPNREQRTQKEAPATSKRSENTERKQVSREEDKKGNGKTERNTSENSPRR